MRTWTRARRVRLCGRCGHLIPKGDPVLEVRLVKVTDPKLRCATCADSPVPPDLPPLVERSNVIAPMVHILTGVGALPLDFKHRQFREPGEDD
jgi:hypothetical protein